MKEEILWRGMVMEVYKKMNGEQEIKKNGLVMKGYMQKKRVR